MGSALGLLDPGISLIGSDRGKQIEEPPPRERKPESRLGIGDRVPQSIYIYFITLFLDVFEHALVCDYLLDIALSGTARYLAVRSLRRPEPFRWEGVRQFTAATNWTVRALCLAPELTRIQYCGERERPSGPKDSDR